MLIPELLFLATAQVDLKPDTWVAVDGLGREVASRTDRQLRTNRTVGMFYFLSNHVPGAPVFDNTELLAANPTNPAYGPYGAPHWWGQPWLGYYQSDDPAVIRKHMAMLANAGVDVIVFDNTNGPTYPDVYMPLCRVLEQMKSDGLRAPQIAFFTGHGAWNTIARDLYDKSLFPDLWFRWKGKPLMMVHLDDGDVLPQAIRDAFSVRESWAWTPSKWFGDGHDKWPWLDNYPQNFGWHEDRNRPEEVAVTVGQHATSSIGRSSLAQHEPPVDNLKLTSRTSFGDCFAQQFDRAIQLDPEFIFITGWNEWTATRFKQEQAGTMAGKPEPAGGSFFVDEYNAEFSRDIEPAKGLLQDNYYYQLVNGIRRFKGARSEPAVTRKSIRLDAGFSQWSNVKPEYLDAVGDTVHRDNPGWGSLHYTNNSGRNDIVAAKVAYDAANVYFYVRTRQPLTPPSGRSWMLLYLNVGGNYARGWLGYNFVLDRHPGDGVTSLERQGLHGYTWFPTGKVAYRSSGNELMTAIPKRRLGLGPAPTIIDFKWADNIEQNGTPSDFTLNGDCAPDDRFNYRARLGR